MAANVPPSSFPAVPLQAVNSYDRHRVRATCEDKRTAAMLAGHTWNILSNTEAGEVYMQNARNSDHYIDPQGRATSHWFQKKKATDLDGDGIVDSVDSTNVEEVMVCPGTAGKQSACRRQRQARQLCQAAAPRDYGKYKELRAVPSAPRTPRSLAGDIGRVMTNQDRLRDLPERPTPRVVDRSSWTPRRGVQQLHSRVPPDELAMFRNLDQLRSESHADVTDKQFHEAMHTAHTARASNAGAGGGTTAVGHRGSCGTAAVVVESLQAPAVILAPDGAPLAGAILAAPVGRSRISEAPPKLANERTRFSGNRVDEYQAREISAWPFVEQHPDRRQDLYHARPVQAAGNNSVKYDILTGARREFFY